MINKLIYHKETKQWEGAVVSQFLKEADVYDFTAVSSICLESKEQQNICTNGGKHKDDRETACKGDSGWTAKAPFLLPRLIIINID